MQTSWRQTILENHDGEWDAIRLAIIGQAIEDYAKAYEHFYKTGHKSPMLCEVRDFFKSGWGDLITKGTGLTLMAEVENRIKSKYSNSIYGFSVAWIRMRLGLTQKELSEIIGWSPCKISMRESGKLYTTKEEKEHIISCITKHEKHAKILKKYL